jgi:hypothetical protein
MPDMVCSTNRMSELERFGGEQASGDACCEFCAKPGRRNRIESGVLFTSTSSSCCA